MNASTMDRTSADTERTHTKRVLPLVIVDASNVAFGGSHGGRKARLDLLLEVVSQIPGAGCEIKVVADASLRHRIDKREEYEGFVRDGFFLQAPAGRSADQFIALLAKKRQGEGQEVRVLTNDLFRQHPNLEPMRITFLEISDGEVVFDPPLGTLNPCRTPTEPAVDGELGVTSEAPVVEPGVHGWR
ncbi:MAG: hypothetical protein WBE40_00820 [Thermoplasmata archaeon]|jgi:hypothetical protein